jgi:uncharacterized repeat protein (TIGR02543 family)
MLAAVCSAAFCPVPNTLAITQDPFGHGFYEIVDGVRWIFHILGSNAEYISLGVHGSSVDGYGTDVDKDPANWNAIHPPGYASSGERWGEAQGDITIPSSFSGVPVEQIGPLAFCGLVAMTSVRIPYGVRRIGLEAFYGCSKLQSVTMPDSVEYLGGQVFAYCPKLKSLTIPESVTHLNGDSKYGQQVGTFAFSSLETLYVPVAWQGTGKLSGTGVPTNCQIIYYGPQTVTFNANGGTCTTSSKRYEVGKTYSSLPTATWTGHTFEGWFTTTNGGTKITSDTVVGTNRPQTVYAHWSTNTYVLALDRQGGTGGAESATATYGSAMPDIAVPTRTGFVFGGYYTAANGTGTQYYTAEGKSARAWDKTSATTLYAYWMIHITLDQQDGTGGSTSVFASYGCEMPSIVVPTRTGYAFGGYYSERNGGGTQYFTEAGESAKVLDKTSVATLYAKWTRMEGAVGIENVTAEYAWPWGVKISYEVGGALPVDYRPTVKATDQTENTIYTAVAYSLSGDTGVEEGMHHLIWDLDKQGVSLESTNVVFTVEYSLLEYGPEFYAESYIVIDLSAGSNASSYPVTYMDAPPIGEFNTAEYKTTKLVLRLIEPGTFVMGSESQHQVTLTKPYYIGLFEVTQKQYELVMGSNPSHFSGNTRPVEQVSWNTIRGNTNWPASLAVSADSFMGRLRARTGLEFDLPTEAQWEYACRAGTTTAFSYGGSSENRAYMWYVMNSNGHTANVGTKKANPWGLYDMHGNVWEWCLDWLASSLGTAAVTDPKGASSGVSRVKRGGAYNNIGCSSAGRGYSSPSTTSHDLGFRLSLILSEE